MQAEYKNILFNTVRQLATIIGSQISQITISLKTVTSISLCIKPYSDRISRVDLHDAFNLKVLLPFPLLVHGIKNWLSLGVVSSSQIVDFPFHLSV